MRCKRPKNYLQPLESMHYDTQCTYAAPCVHVFLECCRAVAGRLEWQPHGRDTQRRLSEFEAAVIAILLSSLLFERFWLPRCNARLAVLNCTSCPAREEAHTYCMHAKSSSTTWSYADAYNQVTELQVHAVQLQPGK